MARSVEGDLSRIGPIASGENLDQGRLSRTVLAQQCQNLATTKVEVHSVEDLHPAERFPDSRRAENQFIVVV
ncbi:MAG: hypothetical protein RJQ01_01490 [Microcella sp.]|uniref:hypothetical protein n=1 Tax=Microcella sp. TaxID=1913979 RepID=UPI003315AD62